MVSDSYQQLRRRDLLAKSLKEGSISLGMRTIKAIKSEQLKRGLIGWGASTQYMTTGEMPVWAPKPSKKLSFMRSNQTKSKSSTLDMMAQEEHRAHPWMSKRLAYRVAQDHLRERKK